MTDKTKAPERIWAVSGYGCWQDEPPASGLRTGQWTEYTRKDISDAKDKRIAELEAKLAKAVEIGLEECPFWDGSGSYNEWWQDRHTTLAELKGTEQ